MKEIFKKVFCEKTITPIVIGLLTFLMFTFVVFPFLTVANTLLNILGAVVGTLTLTFLFYYVDSKLLTTPSASVESGETELDYIPKEEVKKKRVYKKKSTSPTNKSQKK